MNNQPLKTEDAFVEYIKPMLRKGQRIIREYRCGQRICDAVIMKGGIITHIFEIKNNTSQKKENTYQLKEINDAYYSSQDGNRAEVGLYLVAFENGRWITYEYNGGYREVNLKRILRINEIPEVEKYKVLKRWCYGLGWPLAALFAFHISRTVIIWDCNWYTELTIPIITLGVFSAILLITPTLSGFVKKISFENITIDLKDSQ